VTDGKAEPGIVVMAGDQCYDLGFFAKLLQKIVSIFTRKNICAKKSNLFLQKMVKIAK
jgi:hypothetical protein